jgi:hypothetical protein
VSGGVEIRDIRQLLLIETKAQPARLITGSR